MSDDRPVGYAALAAELEWIAATALGGLADALTPVLQEARSLLEADGEDATPIEAVEVHYRSLAVSLRVLQHRVEVKASERRVRPGLCHESRCVVSRRV